MPGKSRRRQGKYSVQSKKKKGRSSRPHTLVQQPASAQTDGPVPSPRVPVSSASVPTPVAKLEVIRHPYIAAELRNIGILAAMMVVVLVVLAMVLS